jgi:hypothetical protein
MRFTEINLFGVYLSPAAIILVVAAIAFVLLRWATHSLNVLRRVWHPALFELAVYVILVSGATLFLAYRGR